MTHILGISAGFHDAAVSVIDQHGNIKFAAHSERYSKHKHDSSLHVDLVREAFEYDIDTVAYYERPWLKQLRCLRAGQGWSWRNITATQVVRNQLGSGYKKTLKIKSFNHHLSHAAAGFQTSSFDHATVVVVDSIGEFECVSIWHAEYDSKGRPCYKKLWTQTYPHSLGLFYSAMTQRIGLKPLDEEYILMGMAAYGKPRHADVMIGNFVKNLQTVEFVENLHVGIDKTFLQHASHEDLASSTQLVLEYLLGEIMTRAQRIGSSTNLVYGGGVALNCLANRLLGEYFDKIWIMPCPGDAGSSLGAAALALGQKLNWRHAFLGHHISGDYPIQDLLTVLEQDKIVGVANGSAEFGPRALGNRSLLADPRGSEIKDKVNAIKRRQKFRPFAPVVLEEHANQYFDLHRGWEHSRYMQVVARCRRPDLFPAIVHVDGSSRVQTVPKDQSGIRQLLEAWYDKTGCPLLLNTSLNVRGEPMVNDRLDADRFELLYGIKVCS